MLLKKISSALVLILLWSACAFGANARLMDSLAIAGVGNSTGGKNANGNAYFYDSVNKTTAKTVYRDALKTLTYSQPVKLDSTGCAKVYLDGKYYVKFTDSVGGTVKTLDNVDFTTTIDFGGLFIDVAKDYGRTKAAIDAAIAQYPTDKVTFLFNGGAFVYTESLTWPTNIRMLAINGATFQTSVGKTVDFTGVTIDTDMWNGTNTIRNFIVGNATIVQDNSNIGQFYMVWTKNELHVPGQYATLQAAITAATTGSTVSWNIIIDSACNSTATASIPVNVRQITFRPEGYLDITGQLTFTGQYIEAGPNYIFRTGTVTGNIANDAVYPEWWGADGSDDQVEINKAIIFCSKNADGGVLWGGNVSVVRLNGYKRWKVSGAINIKSGVDIIGSSGTVIEPTADSINIFYIRGLNGNFQVNGFSMRDITIRNPNNKTNIVGLNVNRALHNVRFDRIFVHGGVTSNAWVGIKLNELNWDTQIIGCKIYSCLYGIEATNASAVLNFIDCQVEYNTYGFYLHYETGDLDIMNNYLISGTVCQNNIYGVYLERTSNVHLLNMHFENNDENDVTGVSANNTTLSQCEFKGNGGKRGMKFTYSGWVNVIRPIIDGQRNDTGSQLMYDFDSTNYECFAEHQSRRSAEGGTWNEISSTDIITGIYIKPQYSYIAYGESATTINMNRAYHTITKTVAPGGLTLTYENAKDGQEFNVILRTGSTYSTGNITVFGNSVDRTGIGASKSKWLSFIYSSTYNTWFMKESTGWTTGSPGTWTKTETTLTDTVIEIPTWNMVADFSKTIAHGKTLSKIRSVSAMIRYDGSLTTFFPIDFNISGAAQGGVNLVNSTSVILNRLTGGFFDSVDFDSATDTRGYIVIRSEQ